MLSRSVALVVLVLIPTIADAQRRVRGERREDWSEIDRGVQTVPRITQKDVRSLSALQVIMGKRKDLKLTEEQFKQFKDLAQKEEGANALRYKQVDSLRMAMRRRAGEDSLQERARTTLARQELMSVIRTIRSSYDSTFEEALPLLEEPQKKAATDLVQKEQVKAEEDLRQKMGGGGARQSGGPQPRRRP